MLDANTANQLLPPDGNQDWHTDRMKIASISIEVSDPHSSVATASIVIRRPLDDKAVAGMKEMLKQKAADLDEKQREAVTKWIAARAIDQTMLTMLARQEHVLEDCLLVGSKKVMR